jgi:glycerol-3-phosphate acyltransferase PlsY
MLSWLAVILGSYLCGSIPMGFMIGRLRGIDIREYGSGNIGATNVGRVLGRRTGLLCFALDLLKGFAPVAGAGAAFGLLGRQSSALSSAQMWLWLAVALATVLGHVASVFLGFRGGKGVATGFGALLGLWPLLTIPALVAVIVFAITLLISRYVSLASMVAGASLPISCAGMLLLERTQADAGSRLVHGMPLLIVTSLLALMVVWRHRANIGRISAGTEPRVGSGTRDAQRRAAE